MRVHIPYANVLLYTKLPHHAPSSHKAHDQLLIDLCHLSIAF